MKPAVLIKVTNVGERFLQFQEEYHHDRRRAAIIDPSAQRSQWSLSLAGGRSHGTGADQSHLDFGHLENKMEVITEATLKKNDEIKAHWNSLREEKFIDIIDCSAETHDFFSESDWSKVILEKSMCQLVKNESTPAGLPLVKSLLHKNKMRG